MILVASAGTGTRRTAGSRPSRSSTPGLDADLVVLSACETGVGKRAGGEGYLGFAQALFIKGARSLVLSERHVSDVATRR